MNAWGFEYQTAAAWNKVLMGLGFWVRGQHEFLLIGTRGQFAPPPEEFSVSSFYSEKRTKHSKKPAHFRNLISSWYPAETKLEMFAREVGAVHVATTQTNIAATTRSCIATKDLGRRRGQKQRHSTPKRAKKITPSR